MLRIYQDMLAMITDVRPLIAAIAKHDPSLADQMRRAAQSVVLNAGEGMYSRKQNVGARFHSSLASMRETLACIEVSTAFGYIEAPDTALLDRIDKIIATLFRIVR